MDVSSFYLLQLLLNKITSEQKVSPFYCQTATYYLMHIAKFGAKLSKNWIREGPSGRIYIQSMAGIKLPRLRRRHFLLQWALQFYIIFGQALIIVQSSWWPNKYHPNGGRPWLPWLESVWNICLKLNGIIVWITAVSFGIFKLRFYFSTPSCALVIAVKVDPLDSFKHKLMYAFGSFFVIEKQRWLQKW